MGPWLSSRHTAMGPPGNRSRRPRAQFWMAVGWWSRTEHSGLPLSGAGKTDVVFAIGPVDTDERCEGNGDSAWDLLE